ARGLLLVLPAGLGPENAHHVIEADFGAEVSSAEVARLHGRTVQDVFPELARYLEADSLELAARRLGCSPSTLCQHVPTSPVSDLLHADTREAALRKIIRGDTNTGGDRYGFLAPNEVVLDSPLPGF